jgi:type II secretory pathway component GspD/PulD (secretin)
VPDGETVVVGGLNRKDDSRSSIAIPYLSKLPWIGRLFRSETTSRNDNDVLFFVTPTIVRDPSTEA